MTLGKSAVLSVLLLASVFISAQTSNTPKTVAERLGYPANSRLLMIHADDFGMSHSVNSATMDALEKHWITSASIMVPCPWFPEVVTWAKQHPEADLGVHLTLNADWTGYRWGAVSPQPKSSTLLDKDGYLPLTTEEVVAHAKMSDVETEGRAQIDKALASGIRISHLDTHMGTIVSSPDLLKVYLGLGEGYKLPVLLMGREQDKQGAPAGHMSFLGVQQPSSAVPIDEQIQITSGVWANLHTLPHKAGTPDWLNEYKRLLSTLPPGVYQLTVHLGVAEDELYGMTWDHPDWGAQWRQDDYDLVKNPEFHKFLKDQGFILVTWKDLAKAIEAGK